jgi:hypothetical protein
MAMWPAATETPIISEIHRRRLREEWAELACRELDGQKKQKWVLSYKHDFLCYYAYKIL